ncbi:MAG: T9SS type A sorting domain-containing protein [Saprospirales bacterium]|nr:T9SS type A sorting domain-containing protein [Saprospirales bacterium]
MSKSYYITHWKGPVVHCSETRIDIKMRDRIIECPTDMEGNVPNCPPKDSIPVFGIDGELFIDFHTADTTPGVIAHKNFLNGTPYGDGTLIPLAQLGPGKYVQELRKIFEHGEMTFTYPFRVYPFCSIGARLDTVEMNPGESIQIDLIVQNGTDDTSSVFLSTNLDTFRWKTSWEVFGNNSVNALPLCPAQTALFVSADSTTAAGYYPFKIRGIILPSDETCELPLVIKIKEQTVGIHEAGGEADHFILSEPYPNPSTSTTTIELSLFKTEQVLLRIFNFLGQDAGTLVSGSLPAGKHQVEWQPGNLPKGVYFFILQAGAQVQTRAVALH